MIKEDGEEEIMKEINENRRKGRRRWRKPMTNYRSLPAVAAFVRNLSKSDSFATRDASLHSDDGLLDEGVRTGESTSRRRPASETR